METIVAITLLQAFDTVLIITLLWLACGFSCSDLYKGIILFIAFGLLMALAWVRLNAPDIALAEAAIGAGLTGALLLAALARLESMSEVKQQTNSTNETNDKPKTNH